jgi:glyoxylase-like metal-dependent hydrolase (beta-lactamase superfamily II)/8-oxo-dGTP pyrophosphatase MutT (NUDIX family)
MKLKPSAVAIVLARDAEDKLLALVGMRNPKSSFLGGYFAFPGGAYEPADREDDLRVTASRELYEETGMEIPAERFLAAGSRATPPFVARGFDTRMFVTMLDQPEPPATGYGDEMLDIQWTRPDELLRRWHSLEIRVAPPLLPIFKELARVKADGAEEIARRIERVNSAMEEDGPRIEFVPDVLMIPVKTSTLPPATHTNCYLFGKREVILLDPGCTAAAEQARLSRHVKRRIDEGTSIKAIFLTHHHEDHAGGVVVLAEEFGVPVYAHEETLKRLAKPTLPSEPIKDGETMTLSGGERIRALHTPGHAPGHLAYYEESQRSLFAGDLVSGVSTIVIDALPGSLDRYLKSLERIRELDAFTLFPGHGPPLIDPRRSIQHVLDHRAGREAKILDAVREGALHIDEIVRRAYADTPEADPRLAQLQSQAMLERLEAQGHLRRERDQWKAAH